MRLRTSCQGRWGRKKKTKTKVFLFQLLRFQVSATYWVKMAEIRVACSMENTQCCVPDLTSTATRWQGEKTTHTTDRFLFISLLKIGLEDFRRQSPNNVIAQWTVSAFYFGEFLWKTPRPTTPSGRTQPFKAAGSSRPPPHCTSGPRARRTWQRLKAGPWGAAGRRDGGRRGPGAPRGAALPPPPAVSACGGDGNACEGLGLAWGGGSLVDVARWLCC